MIVREKEDCFVLFKQYDHSVVSGVFAAHWQEKPEPYASVHCAIQNHDIGWELLDHTVLWNEEMNEPYSFIDHPVEHKLPAYKRGIDLVESEDSYAGYLCSRHFASFFRMAKDEASILFLERENERQRRLKQTFTKQQQERLDVNFRLLQMCDDLSLFVCLNEPGENTFPWYRNGFKWDGTAINPVWKDPATLTFTPYPFTQSFEITIPYQLVNRQRHILQHDELTIQVVCH